VRDALDVAGLAHAIERLEAPAGRVLGEAARAAILPYSPAAMAEEYLALYRRLLRR